MDSFLFLAGGAVALAGALITVVAKHVFHAALGLAIALAGTAGLFVPLNGELIAVVQILVYLGAVATAIVFILMLSPPYYLQRPKRNPWKMLAAAIIATAFVLPLGWNAIAHSWGISGKATTTVTVQQIGQSMLTEFVFPFEIISLVLTVVIIAAIVIARDLPANRSQAVERENSEPESTETVTPQALEVE